MQSWGGFVVEELTKIICFNIDTLSACEEPCLTCVRQAEAALKFIAEQGKVVPFPSEEDRTS